MSPASSVERPSRAAVLGGVRLKYKPGVAGQTQLSEQWVRPPLHLAKAYHEGGWVTSVLTSPTAGLLSGDRLEVAVDVAADSKVALISPAACRVHTMHSGEAVIDQRYVVGAGAILDIWPAPLVLQRGASLRQSTHLDVLPDATVLLCEIVSPGRAAHGETFEFTSWGSTLRINCDDRLVAYENFSLCPSKGDAKDWSKMYPSGNYASIYVMSPRPLGELVQVLHDLDTPDAFVGVSPLRSNGLGIKVLAADGISLRRTLFELRAILEKALCLQFPAAAKRAQTFFS